MSDLEGPAARLAAALADRYRIERELGQGGMATVYLAEDLKHHRQVAIKVLRPDLAAALGPERFTQEIEIAARLQHPHILPVHDSGESGGFLYYVMPYVEGESLRERLTNRGELPVHDAVRLLAEVAEALAYAHSRGVVHRDIKPENIMLSGRHALVMDFGVAKAVSEASGRNRLTTAGVALGTPAYMAPEQATADPNIDQRVDIYALGILGYELLTGRTPFGGVNAQQILAAQITAAPDPVTTHRPSVSPALADVVMRALQKRPADRWQTADEMLAQLEPALTPSGGITPSSTRPITAATLPRAARRVPMWALAVLGGLVLSAAGYGVYRVMGRSAAGGPEAQSVAVLPFTNLGGDSTNRTFTDGIQDEILTDLTRVAALQVTSRNSVQEYRDSPKGVRQIGTELGVRTLLQGQVQRAGDQVRVNVQLVDAPKDRQIWAESYNRQLTAENVFAIQGDIAQNVAQALQTRFSAASAEAVGRAPTSNLDALDWYHRGKDLFGSRTANVSDTLAPAALERAVGLDSTFAEAWAMLAAARSWRVRTGSTSDTVAAAAALARAVALAPSAAETQLAQAYYAYYALGDYDTALTHFKAAAAIRPSDPETVGGVGYIARRKGRWQEALASGQRVVELDPRNAANIADLGQTYLSMRRYDEAEVQLRRSLILDPNSDYAASLLAILLMVGRGDTAAARSVLNNLPPGPHPLAAIATAGLESLRRQFEASAATMRAKVDQLPQLSPAHVLVWEALEYHAAGNPARARAAADSAVRLLHSELVQGGGLNGFDRGADTYRSLGMAEAILGRTEEALRDARHAVELNPVSRDVMEGVQNVDGLIVTELILGLRDDAIRLMIQRAHLPFTQNVVLFTRAGIRLDPKFDGIRDDPRIQTLLASDTAWVVH